MHYLEITCKSKLVKIPNSINSHFRGATEVYRIGDIIPAAGFRVAPNYYKDNRLVYRSPSFEGYDLDELLEHTISDVDNPSLLGKECNDNGLEVVINIIVSGRELPGIALTERFVHFASQLNATIDLDILF